ncbi:MAG: hypothetical protein AB2733_18040 [Candidatus Thiodiazotropha taylori]
MVESLTSSIGAAGDTLFIASSETDNLEEARRLRSGRIETLTL